jgi:Zn-dependent peptidase ImmA (M78 family)
MVMRAGDRLVRQPLVGLAVKCAERVRSDIGYRHPTELEIDVLAYMRGLLVRSTPSTGARANLVRIGDRGIVSVAGNLPPDQRRWAIAHELGHFEAHAAVSYLGLCTGSDLRFDYDSSGREQEANVFAAELLMPRDLVEKKYDVRKVSWAPVLAVANEFCVSAIAAALRLLSVTYERVAVVACKDGKVAWTQATRSFGSRPKRDFVLDQWSLAYDFFKKGKASETPETVSASAWIPDAGDDAEVVEHVLAMPNYNMAVSLLWFPET